MCLTRPRWVVGLVFAGQTSLIHRGSTSRLSTANTVVPDTTAHLRGSRMLCMGKCPPHCALLWHMLPKSGSENCWIAAVAFQNGWIWKDQLWSVFCSSRCCGEIRSGSRRGVKTGFLHWGWMWWSRCFDRPGEWPGSRVVEGVGIHIMVEGAGRPTCSFVLLLPSPAARARTVTSLLGGLGHHLLRAPLSAPSLTETVRSNLYCGTLANQQKTQNPPPQHLMTV